MNAHLAVIHLELADDPHRHHVPPRRRRAYEITAPVNGSGQLDGRGWRSLRGSCAVRRLDRPEERRPLVCHPTGEWADDEGRMRIVGRTFRPGASVAVREADGETRTYRVTSLRSLAH
jgi:hypothetical protein